MLIYSCLLYTSYETIEEVQPVIERIKQMLIEDSATGCPVTKELDLYYDRAGNNFEKQKEDYAGKIKEDVYKRQVAYIR